MKIHRFFIQEIPETLKFRIIDKRLIHQLKDVLKIRIGEKIIIFSKNSHDFLAEVISFIKSEGIEIKIIGQQEKVVENEIKINLFQALIKKDKFEWIVEKATELGVSSIYPVLASRSEKKSINIDRLMNISIEATEQSGRNIVPNIHEPRDLFEAVNSCYGKIIIFDTEKDLPIFSKENIKDFEALNIFIGPEGGWTKEEIKLFQDKDALIYSLGNMILKSETASIVALGKIV